MSVRRLLAILFAVFFLGGLFLAACASGSPGGSATASPGVTAPPVTDDPAAALLQERCGDCHALQRVTSARKTAVEWEAAVRRMVDKGARLNNAEFALLVEYLAANYNTTFAVPGLSRTNGAYRASLWAALLSLPWLF